MAGTYLPLIGKENVSEIFDPSSVAIAPGTVDGEEVDGRPGTNKTQLLVALDNASVSSIPLATAALLFSLKVKCPPGFRTPASLAEVGFDYSKIFPEVRAEVLASAFDVDAAAWPPSLTDLATQLNTAPANLASLAGRVTSFSPPDADAPYGYVSVAVTGAATTAAVASPLISLTIDFGASVAN